MQWPLSLKIRVALVVQKNHQSSKDSDSYKLKAMSIHENSYDFIVRITVLSRPGFSIKT